MLKRLSAVAIAAIVMTAAPVAASASIFGSNLIVNGDAESGAGALNDSSTVAVPGFVTVGNFTAVVYNAPGGFPVTGDPGVSAGGANFFAGGPNNANSSASQAIDLSSGAAFIDTGTSAFALSAYLGGFETQDDNAVLTIRFLDQLNAVLGSVTLGPVTEPERSGVTGLLFRSTSGFVPIGARTADVQLNMTRLQGSYNDGYADNLSLVLRGPAGGGVPEPATWALMLIGFAGVGLGLRRRGLLAGARA